MNQDKALWCLFLTCITTIIICSLVGLVITVVEHHSKRQCSFEHTEECKCVNFRPYLKHEAFNYDLK